VELTPEVQGVCRRAASSVWHPGMRILVDREDLWQQAYLVALSEPDDQRFDILYVRLRWRLIDYLRSIGTDVRHGVVLPEFVHLDGASDEWKHEGRLGLEEPGYEAIEDADFCRSIFADDRGDPRGRTMVFLYASGVPNEKIAEHFKVSPGRVTQLRGRFLERLRADFESLH
jgi:DNA-directed RNA polymerase specialized sigma24 family protein